jgi:hypothetical protein
MPDQNWRSGLLPMAIRVVERLPVPDVALRLGVRALVGRT